MDENTSRSSFKEMYNRTKILPPGKNYLIFPAEGIVIMTKIGIIYSAGIWTVKPGNEMAFIKTWDSFARWTFSTLEGVQPEVLVQDAENSQKFISFGPWKDMDTLKQWRNTLEFREAILKFRELCSEIQPHSMRCVASVG
jgi:heme-degrading monooxygenase HmoA